MSEDAPTLAPSAPELQQWAYAVNALGQLAARIRMRREAAGRLAFADDENAERVHQVRQAPPIRSMSESEQRSWQERVPREVVAQPHGEPFTVWTAQMSDADGEATSEWGLEAHTWDSDGRPSASLFVVCRDAADALALTRYLRENPSREELDSLQKLAVTADGRFVQPAARVAEDRNQGALSEHEWEAALRRQLSPDLADRIIVNNIGHDHYSAWRALHQLARQEVARVGANPDRLAALVRSVPRWRGDVQNPPALAHWAITEARTAPNYEQFVCPAPTPPTSSPTSARETTSARHSGRLHLGDVRSPQQAHEWVRDLDSANTAHRLEARTGYGHWGEVVDAALLKKFPGLVQPRIPERQDTRKTVSDRVLEQLATEVDRLDPAAQIDRQAAVTMLGHVPPAIDQRIAAKFGDDPVVAEKVQQLYPHGFDAAAAEAEAAAWRNRADADEHAAARARAVPDQPSTPQREDRTGQAVARAEQAEAAAQHGIAHSIAAAPARTPTPAPPRTTPGRRR